jgi:hypothetical protein
MGEYQNYNSVVVNLEPTENAQTGVRVATYDQAFLGEEFSDAKGRGRARRKSRKLSKIADKREVRTARRKLKGDRQEERIARRKTRKEQRQEIRNDQQDARMERRNKRREEKENKGGGKEAESEEEEDTTPKGGSTDDGQDSGSTDSDSSDSQDTSTSGGGYDDDSSDEDSDSSDTEEDSTEDEDDSTGEADESFAGDSSNFASEITGKPSVPSAIQSICFKIEMNNEMINQLMQHKKMLEDKSKDSSKINDAIVKKFNETQALEDKLQNFSGANGQGDPQKAKVVRIAKAKARKQRIENLPIPPIMLYKLLKKGVPKDKIKHWWEAKGRKAHARKMNFDGGTDELGITESNEYNDYDLGAPAYDYDQPQTQVVDLDSPSSEQLMNFSGGTSSDGYWKSLLIGGLVAFVGVYLVKKYKLLK